MIRWIIIFLGLTFFIFSFKERDVKTNVSLSTDSYCDTTLVFDLIKLDEQHLYTGGSKSKSGDVVTNGIYIKRISDNEIEYDFSQLVNWKEEFNKKGIASLVNDLDSLITENKMKEFSFKFIDSDNDRVIYITKSEYLNQTKAKVLEEKTNTFSNLMFNKY